MTDADYLRCRVFVASAEVARIRAIAGRLEALEAAARELLSDIKLYGMSHSDRCSCGFCHSQRAVRAALTPQPEVQE